MADRITPGPVDDSCGIREAVCVHTKKIFSSCRDKDCIEDLCFYPTASAQQVLNTAQTVKGGTAELLYIYLHVEPVTFNRGFYTVDMRFFYRVTLQTMCGTPRSKEVEGLCVFDKRVILFGSEGSAKIFSSDQSGCCVDLDASNLPTAVVEAVDPIVLEAKLVECCHNHCGNSCFCCLAELPETVACSFSEPLVFDENNHRRVFVTLGQFSIVRLERDTQLLMPIYDYCIPECECVGGSSKEPCDLFRNVCFPVNEFFPPNSVEMPSDYAGTRNYCCGR